MVLISIRLGEVPEYTAPELLKGKTPTMGSDWYTLGVFLYEMLTGLPPFWEEDEDAMRRKVLNAPLSFLEFVSLAAKGLLTELLERRPECRWGANGAGEVKGHVFFRGWIGGGCCGGSMCVSLGRG